MVAYEGKTGEETLGRDSHWLLRAGLLINQFNSIEALIELS